MPLEVLDRTVAPAGDGVRVHYRARPAADPRDDLVLDVVEDYRVTEDGAFLTGTINVEFLRDGAKRGSYVLSRRFERVP